MDLVAFAKKVRSVRMQRGLTLEELARKASVSKSLISRIENFRITPSLPVVLRLAETLAVTPGELLDGVTASVPDVLVVKRAERRAMQRNPERRGCAYLGLAGIGNSRAMQAAMMEIRPEDGEIRPLAHEGEEFNIVIRGTVRFLVGKEEYVLAEGDSIYLDGRHAHAVSAGNGALAQVLTVSTSSGRLAER